MERNSYQEIYVSDENLRTIKKILYSFVPDLEVRAFGSRIQGADSSDLDLVLVGEEQLEQITIIKLKEALEKPDIPFRIKILDFYTLSDEFKKVVEEEYDILQEARRRD